MKKFVIIVLALSTISACSLSPQNPTDVSAVITPTKTSAPKQPTIIHHSAPKLKVNLDWVEEAGCQLNEYSSGYYSGYCSSESPLYKMGCESILATYLFGGLPFQVVTCTNSNLEPLGPHYVERGCLISERTEALVAFINGTYQFVGQDDIKAMSAPIESPNEALSYVLVSGDYYARYAIELDTFEEYLVDQIDDTFVEVTDIGYLVHVFRHRNPCGCQEHILDAVTVFVGKGGSIKVIDSYSISKNETCVD